MKIKHTLIFLINIFILSPTIVQSQFEFHDTDSSGTILPVLQSQIRALYGNHFEIYFVVLDSMIGNVPLVNVQEAITDPYGTLEGIVFFWAAPNERDPENEDSVVVGMFKNGSIIWNTPPVYKGGIAQIYATRDLNNDGDIDLVTLWSPSNIYDYSTDIKIFSWNGSSAELISDYDLGTREAKVMTTGSILDLIDVNADNIYDLRAYWSDQEDIIQYFPSDSVSTRPWITYAWNGVKYELGSSGVQIPGNALLPANRLSATAYCKVLVQNDRLKYGYTFSNNSLSQQSIQLIIISGLADTASMSAPMNWITGASRLVPGRLFFVFEHLQSTMVLPNQTVGGFSYESNELPTIVKYYIQGMRPHAYDRDENPISDEAYRDDILLNSFSGYTIGTSDTSQLFIPLTFLDTLTSYTTQSHTLGWIKDQSTADKYLGYFSTAKTKIQQNDTAAAKSTLRQVLSDVNVDSSSTLTSEAYALLRFNTEYLIPRIVPLDTLRVPSQYATIQAAINAADSGKIVLVSAGMYNEQDSIINKKSLKLIALDTLVPLGNVTIQGITISNSSNITVKGFKIYASSTSQDAVQLTGTQNTNITIEANDMQYSSKNGIALGQNNDNINIVNNVIANNDQNGINFATGATGTQYIVNNTIVKNGKCGIEAVGPQKLLIVNNIIIYDTLSGRSGERLVRGAGITYIMQKNNLVLRRLNGVLQSDYRLVPGSIAIDKGTTNFAPLPSKDKDGNSRVSGTTIDVGAYEYQQ